MKLYRIRNTVTGKFYRHRYGQFRGGDWVDTDKATIWTKPGGVNGANGSIRGNPTHPKATYIVEPVRLPSESA
jgi:hypothetical protein